MKLKDEKVLVAWLGAGWLLQRIEEMKEVRGEE